MSDVKVKEGKVVCPECGSENLMHSYNVSLHGKVRVGEDGEAEAYGHGGSHCYSEASNYRLFCLDCSWAEIDCDLDVT